MKAVLTKGKNINLLSFFVFLQLSCSSYNSYNNNFNQKILSADELKELQNSGRYCSAFLDVNADGHEEIVLFNKPLPYNNSSLCLNDELKYFGDTMYFITKINDDSYKVIFEGYNFSSDGGFQTQEINSTNDSNCLFYIYTVYPKDDFTAKHYVKYADNNWILEFTEYQTTYKKKNSNHLVKYNCRVTQKIDLKEFRNDSLTKPFNYIPDESIRDKVCDTFLISIE